MMTETDIRNLIAEDIAEKMLGPGYAKDVIACSPNAEDEILPEAPQNLYSLGVLAPLQKDEEAEPELVVDIDESNQEVDNSNEFPLLETEDEAKSLDIKLSGSSIEDSDEENVTESSSLSSSHIGLITCLNNNTAKINIDLSYGTYSKLSWEKTQQCVRVKTGRFTASMKDAISAFAQSENVINMLSNDLNRLPPLNECINVDAENGMISISDKMVHEPRREKRNQSTNNGGKPLTERTNLYIKNNNFTTEADFVNILLGNHYRRTQHSKSIPVTIQAEAETEIYKDDFVSLLLVTYTVKNKIFLKLILRAIGKKHIFQPQIIVKADERTITDYTDEISRIDDDEEYNISEFIYREVANYGKGINCAVDWNENHTQVFTTFLPTVDAKRFSNQIQEDNNGDINKVCQLRNISIWSKIDIIEALNAFVGGYAAWHQTQCSEADTIQGFNNEKKTIIDNQEGLLTRLEENVAYLRDHPVALESFKIANTAMLMQMVVARHPAFKKNRDHSESEPDFFDNLEFFQDGTYLEKYEEQRFEEPSYYPFQLAFLLMNVKSTFDPSDPNRKIVDLIWFPTGGGKTEAYLALTALTIVARRGRGVDKGVSVIMRYTLRLLTTQQFERATYLICALEFLRRNGYDNALGNSIISIGLFVGSGVTPNSIDDLRERGSRYKRFIRGEELINPFPVSYCPWCGAKLVKKSMINRRETVTFGYCYDGRDPERLTGGLQCLNPSCEFSDSLPIEFIDQQIYNSSPSLLLATVDKFAQLTRSNAAKLLNPDAPVTAPDLIIQDELHLLTGALGSIVGLYESIVEELILKNSNYKISPKIIASTATTRNTHELISHLYGRDRESSIFPPSGISYKNNYFSKIIAETKRRHIGMMPSGHVSSNIAEIRLAAFLLLTKVKVIKAYMDEIGIDWMDVENVNKACNVDGYLRRLIDNYWTTVFYLNSLKDLGRAKSRVGQEIVETVMAKSVLYSIPKSLTFFRNGFSSRMLEFTSRIDSKEIKTFLTKAQTPVALNFDGNQIYITSGVDYVFASNMISVGIDIERWNVMVMAGQPRSTSEYIQASSRAARKFPGLVINLMNPIRIREHSLFESFINFHNTYYKAVEPLSITPVTPATIQHRVINNMALILKQFVLGNPNLDNADLANVMIEMLAERFSLDDEIRELMKARIRDQFNPDNTATSLREIAPHAYIDFL